MEMIFSLVSSAQEFLNCKYDEIKSQEEADKLKKKQALEEAERVCTYRNFFKVAGFKLCYFILEKIRGYKSDCRIIFKLEESI